MGNILVIQTAFLGDVILVTPLLRAIREALPGSHVSLMVIPSTVNIVETNPFIKELLILDKRNRDRGIRATLRIARMLRERRFDIALLPHRSFRSALLAKLAGIPIRVGFDRSPYKMLYSHVVAYHQNEHEIHRNLHLLRPFGVGKLGLIRPEIFCSRDDEQAVEDLAHSQGVSFSEPMVALAPGSVWPTKRWPEEHFLKLADLCAEKGMGICLIGGQVDRQTCERIAENSRATILNACGKLSLRQTAALLRRCRVLVSNDSAPTHLGSAVNVATITIFGSTIPDFGFGPVSSKHIIIRRHLSCQPCTDHGRKRCPRKSLECLISIKPEEVFEAIETLMKESRGFF